MSHVGSLELFKIGIGPSSSHTVGPMRAAEAFARELLARGTIGQVARVTIALYGSLGATGPGHGTVNALIRGLALDQPESCDPVVVANAWETAGARGHIDLAGSTIAFGPDDITFHPLTRLPKHSNGMTFRALDADGVAVHEASFYSVGGGFIERDGADTDASASPGDGSPLPHEFLTAAELIERAESSGLTIAQIATLNDEALHGQAPVAEHLSRVWQTMKSCIERGVAAEGVLPGTLNVTRRARAMANKMALGEAGQDQTAEWLQVFAIAVNEENAAGGRVVTAPTNGAAGIIPAVAMWAHRFRGVSERDIEQVYLPTAAAIGSLYKRNASISGAEAGCQGEVGSACSMAAAGLAAVLGGTPAQIENAAEIAMEHNLGLTCDPVGGYVQMPCIERNAIAAGTAVAATRMALLGDGSHKISLDTVIETMRQTGEDMSHKYKETSMGGLAVNVVEC